MFFRKYLLPVVIYTLCSAVPAQEFKKHNAGGNSTRISGTLGFDLSIAFTKSDFQCLLKDQDYKFAIIRAYRSIGVPDSNAKASIENARAAGISNVDVYMFPCPKCGNASGQVKDMVNAINGTNYGQIWLDIEGSQYWTSNQSANQEFFEELLSTAQAYRTTGVYTSDFQWEPIMGSSYTGGSSAQLWYAHYDDKPSFSDFKSFGGWTRPAIKQYKGGASACGVQFDEDWY